MKSFRERSPIPIGIVGTVVLIAIAVATFYSEQLPVIGGGTVYQAQFSESAGLKPDNEVVVAGIKVGEVTDIELATDRVLVSFRVNEDTWIGNKTSAEIKIKTTLGRKMLALHPLGETRQDPDQPIPLSRTVTPYDVTAAFEDLASTVGAIDTNQLAKSFRTLSQTFENTPNHVSAALDGLSALSETLASRDDQIARLLDGARQVSSMLADSSDEFDQLIDDGNKLLSMLNSRRGELHNLLVGTQRLAKQLSGLVADNQRQLAPALQQLDKVTAILQRHTKDIDRALELAGPYFRMINNSVGNGRWIDVYICGLVKDNRGADCKPPQKAGGGE